MDQLIKDAPLLSGQEVKEFIDQKKPQPTNFTRLFFQKPPENDGITFKEKGMAAMQEYIEKVIYSDPDVTFPELMEVVRSFDHWIKMDEEEFKTAQRVLVNYLRKHESVREVYEKFTTAVDVFEYLFGKKPIGKVEIVEGPITLYFRCFNPEDFNFVYKKEFFISDKDRDEAIALNKTKVLGVMLASSDPNFWTGSRKGLEGAILLENTSLASNSQSIITHEEWHSLYQLFSESNMGPTHPINSKADPDYIILADIVEDPAKTEELVRHYLYTIKRAVEEQAKDELLAYLKEGEDPSMAYYRLTKPEAEKGAYDFLSRNVRTEIRRSIRDTIGDKYMAMIRDEIEIILNKGYQKALKEAKEGMERLLAMGYSRERVVFMLLHHPLSRWNRIAKRATF